MWQLWGLLRYALHVYYSANFFREQVAETEREPGGEAEAAGARPIPVAEEETKESERVPEARLPNDEREEPAPAPVACDYTSRGAEGSDYDIHHEIWIDDTLTRRKESSWKNDSVTEEERTAAIFWDFSLNGD